MFKLIYSAGPLYFINFRNSAKHLKALNMSAIERIKQNADLAKESLNQLKNELSDLNKEYHNILAMQLQEENAQLLAAVEKAKQNLIDLETKNGIRQIVVPNQKVHNCLNLTENENKSTSAINADEKPKSKQEATIVKNKKEKKVKEPVVELPVDIGRLDLKVAIVEDVKKHPDADALYVLKVNCGEEKLRTVCSGLVKHIALEDLQKRYVLLLCNLKPVKMRGITSEAMVMCASSEQGVEVLLPPEGCSPGDIVQCDGYIRQPDLVMNPKKKIFETVAPDLHTNDKCEACYKGTPLQVPGKGTFVSKSLKNVPVK